MTEQNKKRERVYQVSSNREKSSHKLRYVEASAPQDDDCRLCVGSLATTDAQSSDFIVANTNYNDISKIAFLEKQFYSNDAYSAAFFYQALRQWPHTFLTLKTGEKTAGYSLMVPVSDSGLSLMSLLVGKMFQGKGLGKLLLSDSIALARSLGYKQMELSVAPDNTSAVSLYQSFGFETIQTVRDYLGPGQDRLLMTLSLMES